MPSRSALWLLPTLAFALTALAMPAHGQDGEEAPPALSAEDLAPHTYYVQIEDGRFVGPGAAFLEEEARFNQYVLIGEYHGSKAISEFTNAFIPLYDEADAKYLMLEVGPRSAEVLANLAARPEGAHEQLRRLNETYSVRLKSGRVLPPIPFFQNESDAEFLQTAADADWDIVGIDQEFIYGGLFLLDDMWERLSTRNQRRIEPLYRAARDTLAFYEEARAAGESADDPAIPDLDEGFLASETIDAYLDAVAAADTRNARTVGLLRRSMGIYATRGRAQNIDRVQHFVDFFYSGLEEGFDPEHDKVLVKMGGTHVWKGHNWQSLLDVGTAIYERARSRGASSLHTTFLRRYWTQPDSTVLDLYEERESFRAFREAARADEWTIIDLRPFRAPLLSRRPARTITDDEREYLLGFDVVILPPIEELPTMLAQPPAP